MAIEADTPTRNRKVKELIADQIPSDGVIYEFSQERYEFDPEGSFIIHEETIGVDPDTNIAESHVNTRRMGHLDMREQLYRPDDICEEAFMEADDKLCCQRQIASILQIDLQPICSILDEIDSWCSVEGCTPNVVLEFAKQCNYGCVCLHNNRPTLMHQGTRVLAFNILSSHTYFYRTQSVAKQILKWGGWGERATETQIQPHTNLDPSGADARNPDIRIG